MARFRKIGLKERGLYKFYKKNPGVPQAYWFRVRNFKTALDTMAEVMMNILTFDTIDSKMQTLAGKCYLEWAAQRRIDGLDDEDYVQFLKDCQEGIARKFYETLKMPWEEGV